MVDRDKKKVKDKIYIGLTGRMGSGKGEVVKILQEFSFKYISLSDIVREEAKKRGKNVSRLEMQDIGNSLRELEGPGVLGKRIREKIEISDYKKWIIDGIRNPAEISELKKLNSFFLLGLNTNFDIIQERIKKRRRDTDKANSIELKRRLDREWGIGEPEHGQQVGKCMKLSDFTVNNNKTLKNLRLNILKIIGEQND